MLIVSASKMRSTACTLEVRAGAWLRDRLQGVFVRSLEKGMSLPYFDISVVVKIRVPFWAPIIVRHLVFRVPKKGS